MRLLELTLRNFQGGNDAIKPNGSSLNVWGTNAAGKTRLASAFSWALFGKDSLSRSDFEILPLAADGKRIKEVTQAEVEVKLAYDLPGDEIIEGRQVTLKRVYSEKWGQRGAQRGKFLGHTTDYFIDEVPKQEKSYKDFVNQMMPEARFRLLSNPLYANDVLPWTELRQVLVDFCGDVTTQDVVKANSALAEVPKLLEGRTFEDAKAVIDGRKKALRKSLDEIPARVDEANRALPTDTVSIEEVTGLLRDLAADLKGKQEERAELQSGGGIGTKMQELRMIDADMQEFKTHHIGDMDRQITELKRTAASVDGKIRDLNDGIARKGRRVAENETQIAAKRLILEACLKQWKMVNDLTFKAQGIATVCPTCEQDLPVDRVEAAVAKAQAAFNLEKASGLEKLVNQGKADRTSLDKLIAENAELAHQQDQDKATIDLLAEEWASAKQNIERLEKERDAFESHPTYLSLKTKQKMILDAIEAIKGGAQTQVAQVDSVIAEIQEKMAQAEKIRASIQQAQTVRERIEKLLADEKAWNGELSKLERTLELMDQFTRTKMAMLTERINSRFEMARFKLFDEQINEVARPCCITTFGGIPWDAGLNHGAQIAVGLDIIRTLQADYKATCPCFVDNCEAITELPEMKCQMIRLYVSAADAVLRVEAA